MGDYLSKDTIYSDKPKNVQYSYKYKARKRRVL